MTEYNFNNIAVTVAGQEVQSFSDDGGIECTPPEPQDHGKLIRSFTHRGRAVEVYWNPDETAYIGILPSSPVFKVHCYGSPDQAADAMIKLVDYIIQAQEQGL